MVPLPDPGAPNKPQNVITREWYKFFITVPVSPLYFHPNVRKKERRHAIVTWKKNFS
jgi:hypothetical protein